MRGGQHPLSADQRSPAEILVQRVDQRHLPTPLGRVRVFAADYSRRPRPSRALYAAHILAVRRRFWGYRIWRGQRGHRGVCRKIDWEKMRNHYKNNINKQNDIITIYYIIRRKLITKAHTPPRPPVLIGSKLVYIICQTTLWILILERYVDTIYYNIQGIPIAISPEIMEIF